MTKQFTMMEEKIDTLARQMIATKTGIGMTPPFFAETASANGNQDCPFWIVRNATCNSLGAFFTREGAELLAAAMDRASSPTHPAPVEGA